VTRTWSLPTARTTYTVGLGLDDTALLHLGWGPIPRLRDGGGFRGRLGDHHPAIANEPTWELPSDLAPVEYASAGSRHLTHSELLVDHGDGLIGVRWRYRDADGGSDGSSHRLVVRFVDTTGTLRLDLHTHTDAAHDVVRRWAELVNTSDDRTVTLRRAMSGGWCVPAPDGARIHYLAGRWGREFTPQQVDLRSGAVHLGSRQGITSHAFSPVLTVQPLAPDGTPDPDRGTYATALAWSGSWSLVAEALPASALLRASFGWHDDALAVPLAPGERLRCPETLGLFTPGGPEDATRSWHAYQRRVLARSTGPEHRPVVYNSWYATEFDVRPDQQLAMADVAAELGVEAYVVDDGWFRGRDTDRRGLGDWEPDETVFPDGFDAFVEGVLARGMRFGLWIEPESVNPDSDLYRRHPDWVYRAGDRPLTTMRHQYVLDLGRHDVEEWVATTVTGLLRRYPVTYLKWDMNRPVTDGGRPGDPRSGAWSIDHTRAYYRVMAMLRRDFPNVTIEACAGGGGRIDPAVLALSDVVWPSDETGPRDRLAIQDGFLRAYSPHVMSSWVTDLADQRDTRPVTFGFRFVTAMAGVLGIGADLGTWSTEQRADARRLVDLYKQIRAVVHEGEVTRLGDPRAGLYSVQYAGDRRHGNRVVVLVWADEGQRGSGPVRLRVPAASPSLTYRLPDGTTMSGAALADDGLVVPWGVAPDADVVVLEPLAESG
jgi:alpha-galactosidase